jgi:hypothetical protein
LPKRQAVPYDDGLISAKNEKNSAIEHIVRKAKAILERPHVTTLHALEEKIEDEILRNHHIKRNYLV